MPWLFTVIRHPGRLPVGGATDGIVPGFEFFHALAGGGKGEKVRLWALGFRLWALGRQSGGKGDRRRMLALARSRRRTWASAAAPGAGALPPVSQANHSRASAADNFLTLRTASSMALMGGIVVLKRGGGKGKL